MTVSSFERVFGRTRLPMPTMRHVEVVREAAAPGERRRYTKRFLASPQGDLRQWTAREGRILHDLSARGARCVPDLVDASGETATLGTFDAGVTVEQWVTLVGVARAGAAMPHVFADCAHWWALAQNLLRALETLHQLDVVHLDVKPDNLCVPALAREIAPGSTVGLKFARLALIDFAFSVSPAEPLASALPLGMQPGYPYQSPRLLEALAAGRAGDLRATHALDWRCDLFSLAAMLQLYLPREWPSPNHVGWTSDRLARAVALLAALKDAHDRDAGTVLPHRGLIEMCEAQMHEAELVDSLLQGFTLAAHDAAVPALRPSTPLTCIVPADDGVAPLATDSVAVATAPFGVRSWVWQDDARMGVEAHTSGPELEAHMACAEPASGPLRFEPGTGVRVNEQDRAFAAVSPARRGLRPAAGAALLCTALACAAGLAIYLQGGAQRAEVASTADSTAHDTPSSHPADVASRSAVVAANVAHGSASEASPAKRSGSELPVDADTVQRAADAEPAGTPSAQPADAVPLPRGEGPQPVNPSPPAVADSIPAPRHDSQAAIAQPASPATRSAAPSPSAPRGPAIEHAPTVAQSAPPPESQPVRPATPVVPANREWAALAPALDDVAVRTERDVARVLSLAADATSPVDEQKIAQVARSIRPAGAARRMETGSPSLARRLNGEARAAWERQDIDTALTLQQRAFRANPNDPEVTGNLAFYYLKVRPAQPQLARRLALYALAARGQTFPAGRLQDWGTLAVASSLAGRERDATRALYVMLTLSRNPEWACRAARLAVAQYGAPMQAPAQAMLARVHERGGVAGAPSCG